MRTFGLIGKNLSHSFSSGYFNEKFYKEEIIDFAFKHFEDMKDLQVWLYELSLVANEE